MPDVETIPCQNKKKSPPLLKLAFSCHQEFLPHCITPSFYSCAYSIHHLHLKHLFIHSWLWGLQSVRFPGLPSEICPLPYRKSLIDKHQISFFFFFFLKFILSINVFHFRIGSRMSEPWKRPLRKWRFFISLSGKRVFSFPPLRMNCSFKDFILIACQYTCKGIVCFCFFHVFHHLCPGVYQLQRLRCSICRRWKRWTVMDRKAFKPR